MLSQDQPVLTYVHPREWMKKQGYASLSFAVNYPAYSSERDHLLDVLRRLSFEEWGRSATFERKANVYTVFGEVLRMARHDSDHCDQLETMFSRIGPEE